MQKLTYNCYRFNIFTAISVARHTCRSVFFLLSSRMLFLGTWSEVFMKVLISIATVPVFWAFFCLNVSLKSLKADEKTKF